MKRSDRVRYDPGSIKMRAVTDGAYAPPRPVPPHAVVHSRRLVAGSSRAASAGRRADDSAYFLMIAAGPDLVVAGAGGGLVGAIRAAELGLQVVVVEANRHFRRGNNTSMSTAMVPAAGTRYQHDAGIEDDAETFLLDIMDKTSDQADQDVATALSGVSAELVEWMAEALGLEFDLVTEFRYPGHSRHRCHTLVGRHGAVLLDRLVEVARSSGSIDFLCPARLIDVRADETHMPVAIVERPDGTRESLQTSAILLATNGFGADPALVERHLPEIARAHYHGSQYSRGDALRIGRHHGAAVGFLDAYQGHAAVAERSATLVGWATIMHGAIMVNLGGKRFGDETVGYSEFAVAVASQPSGRGWIVMDERIHRECLRFSDYQQTSSLGSMVWADDLDSLAASIGAPVETLAAEVSQLATSAGRAAPDRFGRHFGETLHPPYLAVRVMPALFHTQGGLVVDSSARVLAEDRTVLPGLYASGGAAAGISGNGPAGYLAGNGLLTAFGLAYLAAGDSARAMHARKSEGLS